MSIIRLRYVGSNHETLYATDCGIRIAPGSDTVVRGTQPILQSLGGGVLKRFCDNHNLRAYVLYYNAWMPIDYDGVVIQQDDHMLWQIKIKQYIDR